MITLLFFTTCFCSGLLTGFAGVMTMKRIDRLLAKNLKRRAKEKGFDPTQYKRGWYQVGRRLEK